MINIIIGIVIGIILSAIVRAIYLNVSKFNSRLAEVESLYPNDIFQIADSNGRLKKYTVLAIDSKGLSAKLDGTTLEYYFSYIRLGDEDFIITSRCEDYNRLIS